MGYRVAVVGATGAVGRRITAILAERAFPVDQLIPLASSRSAGSKIEFRGEQIEVRELTDVALAEADLVLASAGAAVSERFLRTAAEAGVTCIDNSSVFRMDEDVPLSVPEVNPEALRGSPPPRLVAVPNCTTITAVLPLGPLHREAGLTELVLSSYQSVSGAGQRGIRELQEQVDALDGDLETELAVPDADTLLRGDTFGKPIAFNAVAKIGAFQDDGFTGEEVKMMAEPRKILSAPGLEVAATSVRVPTVVGHGVSIAATFSRPITVEEARAILAEAPGVELRDDPANGVYPSPVESAGLDVALVGRIRQTPGRNDQLLLFSCADNLRKGAALTAVQIAELLIPRT
ncbi:MAG: aspartate-semialdehyde dehydrogenase [Actinomycetota bacterium]